MDRALGQYVFETPHGGMVGLGGRPDAPAPAAAPNPRDLAIWLNWRGDRPALRRAVEPLGRAHGYALTTLERLDDEPRLWRTFWRNLLRDRDPEARALALLQRLLPVARWRRVEHVTVSTEPRVAAEVDPQDDGETWDKLGRRFTP